MRRRAGGVLVLGAAVCLAACGQAPPPVAERLPQHLARGDAAYEDKRWDDAAEAYRFAFRLVDPTPQNRSDRGYLAYRIARSLVQSARFDDEAERRDGNAYQARTWLDEAEALLPDLRRVAFERAQLLDSDIPDVGDRVAARAAYAAYVAAWAAADTPVPDEEQPLLAHARARIDALTPDAE